MSFASAFLPLGWALGAFALSMLLPALTAFGYDENEQARAFLISALLTAFCAGALIIAARGVAPRPPRRREGFVLAILLWTVLPAFGALPFYNIGIATTAADAYFEAVSGFTTTGATVFDQLDIAERSVLMWRGVMQWLGGLSTIVMVLVLLSFLGGGGMQLFQSAMPRGERDSMTRQFVQALRAIAVIYAGLTAACALLLWLVGMPPFEAFVQSLSTLSTGGFATRDQSIGAFDSVLIEAVLIFFMIAGAINFTFHWAAAQGRGWRVYHTDPEVKLLLGLALAAAIVLSAAFMLGAEMPWGSSFRQSAFMAVSAVTTTGLVTGDPSAWPLVAPLLMMMLMIVGGTAGSTAGGLKTLRFAVLMKMGAREMKRLSHPHGIVRTSLGQRQVDEGTMRAVWSYFCVFLLTQVILTLTLAGFGVDFKNAISFTVAALSNAGAGDGSALAGAVDAGYAYLPGTAKWLLAAAMVLGRLELLTVLVLFSPSFWRR